MLQGTLKAKLDINSSTNMEDFPKETSKQPFRKHLMTTSFLNLKKKLTIMNNQKLSLENTTRKYFGTKIARLTNLSNEQADFIKSYFRYFQEVNVNEFSIFERRIFSITIKSLGNLGIRNQRIKWANLVPLPRILSVCHCKVSIVSNDHENVEKWLSMPIHIKKNIKHIQLGFSIRKHGQLLMGTTLFKYFNNLESCSIDLKDPQQSGPLPVGFMHALCRMKTLKSLELDMSNICLSGKMLTILLSLITKKEPFRWYLKVLLDYHICGLENYPIEIGEVKSILNKLDFLSLNAEYIRVYDKYHDFEVHGYEYNGTDHLSNMKHLTQKRKRILDILFPIDSVRELNLKDLLDNCTSLKGIYIGSLGSCFEINQDSQGEQRTTQNKEVEHLTQSKTWASNIEDIVLSFNSNKGEKNSVPANLLSTLQKQSRNLRFLELFCCDSSEEYSHDHRTGENIYLGRKDKINMPVRGLERFVLLEELKLTSDGSDLHALKPVLRHLLNLKKLHLSLGVGSPKQAPWDKDFPFQSCRNLQELKIYIKSNMKALRWGESFIKNSRHLQKLNVLKIDDQAEPMFLRTFCSLVRILLDLKNLRKLTLRTQVNNSVAFHEMPKELEESFRSSVDALLESLKTEIKAFIISNRKLEKLKIGRLNGFKFEEIRYALR